MITHDEEPKTYSFQSCHGTFMRATNNGLNLKFCDVTELEATEKFTIGNGIGIKLNE
jgi:hypothetical protein